MLLVVLRSSYSGHDVGKIYDEAAKRNACNRREGANRSCKNSMCSRAIGHPQIFRRDRNFELGSFEIVLRGGLGNI